MAEGRTPRSARIAIWVGAAAAILIALAAGAALLRGDAATAECAAAGGVWNFEQQVCEPPHGEGATER